METESKKVTGADDVLGFCLITAIVTLIVTSLVWNFTIVDTWKDYARDGGTHISGVRGGMRTVEYFAGPDSTVVQRRVSRPVLTEADCWVTQ